MSWVRLAVMSIVLCAAATNARASFLLVTDPVPPASRDFGNVAVGTTGNATVKVKSCSGTPPVCGTGAGSTSITSITPGAGCGEFTMGGIALPLTMNNGAESTFTTTYTPTAPGADTCTLTFAVAGGDTGTTVTLTGTGTASQLVVQTPVPPAALSFADQSWNVGTGETKNITVINSGNVAIDAANITVTLGGANANQFALGVLVPADTSYPISPNETATVSVTFNPSTIGDKVATVTFSVNNDGGAADKVVNLTGKGTQSLASVPVAVVFPTGNVGVARTANLTITNNGDAPLNISSMSIAALPNGADFSFTDHGCAGQTCMNPGAIAPSAQSTFVLRCTPSAAGWRAASMTISSDDGTVGAVSVPLKCIGNNLAFGSDKLGPPATATQNVTVANGKATAITYSIASSAPAEFILACTGGCNGRVLAAGQSETHTVAFQAAATGARSANLTLTTTDDNDLNGTTVGLSGTGTQAVIAAAPNPLAFGDVPVALGNGSATDVLITNNGTASLVVSSMSITADATNQFAFNTAACPNGHLCSDPLTIGVGQQGTVALRCDPTSAGDKTATLTFVSDAGNSPMSMPMTCTGTVPDVVVSDLLRAFGTQRVGTTSNPLTFTVANSNAAHTAPMGYSVSVPAGGPFSISCSAPGCNGILAAGASITVSVTFSPVATGPQMANVTIDTADDPDEPSTSVMVTGTGSEPTIAVAPSPLAFADVPVAQTGGATTNLTITNGGSAALTVSSMSITADATNQFSFATASCPNGHACATGFTVPTGAPPANQATVSVRCDPTSGGDKTATLTILSDAPTSPTTVPLTCSGTIPDVVVSRVAVPFGDQRLNTASAVQTFTVSNAAGAHVAPLPYQVTSVGAEFGVTCAPSCSGTLAAGASATVSIVFTPTALGARSGAVTVATAADPDTPTTLVDLTGTGVQPLVDVLAPSPPPLAIGLVDVGATSAPGTITLRNSGTSDLSISGATLVGANAAQFAIASGGVGPQTLATTATHSWTVTCTPSSIGAKTVTLRVTHDAPAPGTNTDVGVTCTGQAAVFTASVVPPAKLDFGQVQQNTDSLPKTFTLTNTGNKAGRVTMLTSTSNVFVPSTAANLANDIAPNSSITVSVIFHPTTTLVVNGQVCGLNTGLGSPTCVDVTGDGTSTGLDLNPGMIDFGAVRFDAAPVTSGVVTITNTGESALRIDTIVSSGAPFTIVNAPTLPVTLPFNGTAIFRVRLTPTPALGTVTKTITVAGVFTVSGAPASSTMDVTARIAAPQVAMTTDTLDFGPFDIDDPGTPITRMVTITNTGDAATGADLHLGAPVLEAGGADFAITAAPAGLVAPGASTTMTVRFDPATAGVKTGRITLPIDALTGLTYTIDLTGRAIDQNVVCNPMTISFPDTLRHQGGEPMDATVTNLDFAVGAGTAAMLDYTAAITGANAADFSFPPADAAGTIAGNGSKRLPITFTPSLAGPRAAQLVVSYQDSGPRSCTVDLTGNGRLRNVAVTPDTVDFGTIATGSSVRLSELASPISLSNLEPAGASSTTVTMVKLAGAGAFAFRVIGGDEAHPLPTAQPLTYDLVFEPSEDGVYQADVELYFDADPEPQYTVHVVGRSVPLTRGNPYTCNAGGGPSGALWLVVALVPLTLRRRRAPSATA